MVLGGPDLPVNAQLEVVSDVPPRPGESFDQWYTRRLLAMRNGQERDWRDHIAAPEASQRPVLRVVK